MARSNDGEQISASAFGVTVAMSGRDLIIIFGMFAALSLVIYAIFDHTRTVRQQQDRRDAQIAEQMELSRRAMTEHMELSRKAVAEESRLNRHQYWLIFQELRIQTGIMSLPEWKRPELVDPEDLEQNIKKHLGKSPQLDPPIFEGNPPTPKPPPTPHMDP